MAINLDTFNLTGLHFFPITCALFPYNAKFLLQVSVLSFDCYFKQHIFVSSPFSSLKHCDFLTFMIQYLCHFNSNVVLNNI